MLKNILRRILLLGIVISLVFSAENVKEGKTVEKHDDNEKDEHDKEYEKVTPKEHEKDEEQHDDELESHDDDDHDENEEEHEDDGKDDDEEGDHDEAKCDDDDEEDIDDDSEQDGHGERDAFGLGGGSVKHVAWRAINDGREGRGCLDKGCDRHGSRHSGKRG